MTAAIVTLIVGVIIVCISFLILDSHNYKHEDEIYNESSDELKIKITELCDTLVEQSKVSLEEYSADIKEKNIKEITTQVEKISNQLSEKAKKEMIDYINKSLSDAFEAYDPDATTKPEPVSYEEAPTEAEATEEVTEGAPAEAEATEETKEETPEETEATEEVAEETPEETEATEEVAEGTPAEAEATEETQEAPAETETTKETQETPTTSTEEEKPEENNKPKSNSGYNSSRKKNRKKNRNRNGGQVKKEAPAPEQIWDDEKNVDEEVAKLYKEGLGIMEIANQLGIGVGETKLIIKNIDNQKQD